MSIAVLVVVLAAVGPASAGDSVRLQTTPPAEPRPAASMPGLVHDIAPAASDAVKVVDAFSAAISQVRLADAAQLLDPQVLILESGSTERSRDEYMRSHAIADAAFMQGAKQQLRYRQARVDGNVAWVATESTIDAEEDGKHVLLLSTETMLLTKTEGGWKIAHIHWSSRQKRS
jgi:ketosteroid isomerase-like protein